MGTTGKRNGTPVRCIKGGVWGCVYLYRVYLGDVGEVGAIEKGPLGTGVLQDHGAEGGGPRRGGRSGGLGLEDNNNNNTFYYCTGTTETYCMHYSCSHHHRLV